MLASMARLYYPNDGIFISSDPLRILNSLKVRHLYQYSRGAPLRWVDPVGLSERSWSDYLGKLRRLIDGGETNTDALFAGLLDYYLQGDPEDDWFWDCEDDMEEVFEAWHQLFGKLPSSLGTEDKNRWDRVRGASSFGDANWDLFIHFSAGAGWYTTSGDISGPSVGVELIDEGKAWWGDLTNTREKHQVGFDIDDLRWGIAGARLATRFDVSECDCRKLVKQYVSGNLKLSGSFPGIPTKRVEWDGPRIGERVRQRVDRIERELEEWLTPYDPMTPPMTPW